MEILLLEDTKKLEHELKTIKKLLCKEMAKNFILQIDSKLESAKITNAIFIRDKNAYIAGVNLKTNNNFSIPVICDKIDIIQHIIDNYDLSCNKIIEYECHVVHMEFKKFDPDNIYPIILIRNDKYRIIGFKCGETSNNKIACDETVINIILNQLQRPQPEKTNCRCIIF